MSAGSSNSFPPPPGGAATRTPAPPRAAAVDSATRSHQPAPLSDPRDHLERTLGLGDTIMLAVSSVIGVGIFLTPGSVAALVPEPRLFLLAWVVGGGLSLAGALANAEMGAIFPRAGGDYVWLRVAFHPLAGFLVGWLTFFVIYAGTVATLAAGFADSLGHFLPLPAPARLGVAIAAIVAATLLNVRGVRLAALLNDLTGWVKVGALATLAIAGWLVTPEALPEAAAAQPALAPVTASGFALALSPILFSYLGWNAPVYVASEIRAPDRVLPRALFIGLGLCTALYLLLNALYVHALPGGQLAGVPAAGSAAATVLFGPLGGRLISGLILISVAGCLSATVLVGPRIAYAMALDGHFIAGVERVHPRYHTPHVALWLQAGVSIALLLLLQRFPSVLDYTTFAIVLATTADVAALYVLRWRRPDLERPYRAWGYPWVPALYLLANAGIALGMLAGRPLECLIALGVAATALPFWWLLDARRRAHGGVPSSGAPD